MLFAIFYKAYKIIDLSERLDNKTKYRYDNYSKWLTL